MGPIRNLFSTSPDLKKTESNKKTAQTDKKVNDNAKVNDAAKSGKKDQVQISDVGREMLTLKMEAARYLRDVKSSEVVSTEEIEAIKERIASRYYFDDEVIDDIVDKLISLPNYTQGNSPSEPYE